MYINEQCQGHTLADTAQSAKGTEEFSIARADAYQDMYWQMYTDTYHKKDLELT